MSKRDFSSVPCAVWEWSEFRRSSESERLAYLYLWVNGHVDSTGCYFLPTGYATTDLGWTDEAFEAALCGLEARKMIETDPEARYVRIPGWFKYNRVTGSKFAKGTLKRIEEIASDKLKAATMAEFESVGGMEKANKLDERKQEEAQAAYTGAVDRLTQRNWNSPRRGG